MRSIMMNLSLSQELGLVLMGSTMNSATVDSFRKPFWPTAAFTSKSNNFNSLHKSKPSLLPGPPASVSPATNPPSLPLSTFPRPSAVSVAYKDIAFP